MTQAEYDAIPDDDRAETDAIFQDLLTDNGVEWVQRNRSFLRADLWFLYGVAPEDDD